MLTAGDLTTPELALITDRVSRLLERYSGLPFLALQYRLCEVGRKKLDLRALKRALAELSDNRRPRYGKLPAGPWRPQPGIYVSADLAQSEAQREAERVRRSLVSLAHATSEHITQCLADTIRARILSSAHVASVTKCTYAREITTDVRLQATGTTIRVIPKTHNAVSIFISHDTEWLFPDDWRLWHFLSCCERNGDRPLVIGRKIAPPTFSLLKTLGAFGLQYYSFVVTNALLATTQPLASAIGWFHVRSDERMDDHAVIERLPDAISTVASTDWTDEARRGIAAAGSCGLASSNTSGPTALAKWADEADLDLPERWRTTVNRWCVFDGYKRRGRTKHHVEYSVAENRKVGSQGDQPAPTSTNESPESRDDQPVEPGGFGRRTIVTRLGIKV